MDGRDGARARVRAPERGRGAAQEDQAPDADTRHAFAERWAERNAAVALERAAAFLDPDGIRSFSSSCSSSTRGTRAPRRDVRVGVSSRDDADDADDTTTDDADDAEPLFGADLPAAPGHARVGGVEIRRRDPASSADASAPGGDRTGDVSAARSCRGRAFVRTRSATRNVEATALALCQNRPLLLEGPAGGGKSAVLEEVAARTGNDDFVVLHLDAQTDSKSLFGSYVVGATPGEFAWQPGALTQAVKQGRWVIIEDVDQAPFEVLAALVPLLEERRLYVPGRGESIHAHDAFQLFGTVTTGAGRAGGSAAASSRADPSGGPLGQGRGRAPQATSRRRCWSAYTRRSRRSRRACWRRSTPRRARAARAAPPPRRAGTQAEARRRRSSRRRAAPRASFSAGGRAHAGRPFTLRDLLRWARRLERLRASELSLLREGVSTSDALPPKLRAAAYEEAADVLCGMLPTGPGRARVLTLVASVWGLSADDATHRDTAYKPSVRAGNGAVAVGRATLPAEAGGSGAGSGSGSSWSNTGHAMRILERVASAVQCVEPVLLVGEAGTGKTALVQQLARLTGVPLTVVNLSNQSESSDFLGGLPARRRATPVPASAAAVQRSLRGDVQRRRQRGVPHPRHALRGSAGSGRTCSTRSASASSASRSSPPTRK